MSLVNDYFLLFHGLHHVDQKRVAFETQIDETLFLEVASLILVTTRNNFDRFSSLQSYKKASKDLGSEALSSLEGLYQLQSHIIAHLQILTKEQRQPFYDALSYLLDESIITNENYNKLNSLFCPQEFEDEEKAYERIPIDDFLTKKENLLLEIAQLKPLFHEITVLESMQKYLANQNFSIGITGVMNAGKSTMLNALMGKELLGTSVVPETANLTVIKFSSTPFAKVIYWNEQEWEGIEQSALSLDAMKAFVKETHEANKDLSEYIQPIAKEVEIALDDLSSFTSAKADKKLANLVKYTEVGCELHFLHEGIEIVDTPGLDDSVIQREAITKDYIASCDLMIHLMNVSQSATQKDIEFIIDAVLYQNVTKLLIVITRADTVGEKEIQEVIDYTKQSLTKQLHEHNAGAKLDFILKNLHFIALSGQMALLHKTGRKDEALAQGFSLEKTGLLKVENYLHETLFGKDNQRNSLIIKSVKKRLSKAIKTELENLRFELALLMQSPQELQKNLDFRKAEKKQFSVQKQQFDLKIEGFKEQLHAHVKNLNSTVNHSMRELQNIIKQRLMDEIAYVLEKQKKKIEPHRIKMILEKSLKHGLIDLLRDYKFALLKKARSMHESIGIEYEGFDTLLDDKMPTFNEEELFEDGFTQGFFTQGNEVLIHNAIKIAQQAKASKLLEVDTKINDVIKEELQSTQTELVRKLEQRVVAVLRKFFEILEEPLLQLSKKMEHFELLLQEHEKSLKDDDKTRQTHALSLHQNIKNIELIAKRCGL